MISENYMWKNMPDIYICEGIYKNAFVKFENLMTFQEKWQPSVWELIFSTVLFNPDIVNYLINKSDKAAPFTFYVHSTIINAKGEKEDIYYKYKNCKILVYIETGVDMKEEEPSIFHFTFTANAGREIIRAEDMPTVE